MRSSSVSRDSRSSTRLSVGGAASGWSGSLSVTCGSLGERGRRIFEALRCSVVRLAGVKWLTGNVTSRNSVHRSCDRGSAPLASLQHRSASTNARRVPRRVTAMTPNSPSASAPSRRSFLASTAVAAAAVAGGMPLLAACGGSGNKDQEGTTSGRPPKKLLPTFVAAVRQPRHRRRRTARPPATPGRSTCAWSTSAPDKLGTGAQSRSCPRSGARPRRATAPTTRRSTRRLGVKVTWQNQDGNTYGEKLGAVLAIQLHTRHGGVPGWELTGKIPNASRRSSWTSAPTWRATRSRSTRTSPRSPRTPGAWHLRR